MFPEISTGIGGQQHNVRHGRTLPDSLLGADGAMIDHFSVIVIENGLCCCECMHSFTKIEWQQHKPPDITMIVKAIIMTLQITVDHDISDIINDSYNTISAPGF